MEKPFVNEVFTDNGEHSHWNLIDTETGINLWSECPEEDKACGFPVKERALANVGTSEKDLRVCEVIAPLLSDQDIEEYIWEEISIPLNNSDKENHTEGYVSYLNAVHWAKWGRDNSNGL